METIASKICIKNQFMLTMVIIGKQLKSQRVSTTLQQTKMLQAYKLHRFTKSNK